MSAGWNWKYGLLKHDFEYTWDDKPISCKHYELVEIYGSGGYAKDLKISGDTVEDVVALLEMILLDLKNNLEVIEDAS